MGDSHKKLIGGALFWGSFFRPNRQKGHSNLAQMQMLKGANQSLAANQRSKQAKKQKTEPNHSIPCFVQPPITAPKSRNSPNLRAQRRTGRQTGGESAAGSDSRRGGHLAAIQE